VLVGAQRVADQREHLVHLGELDLDVEAARVELEDLLVDRDGLQEEALVRVLMRDASVGLDRLRTGAAAGVEVTDLQPGANIGGVRLHELAKLRDRPVVVALRQVLLGGFENLGAIDTHVAVRALAAPLLVSCKRSRSERANPRPSRLASEKALIPPDNRA
jgi:hypothetical protein